MNKCWRPAEKCWREKTELKKSKNKKNKKNENNQRNLRERTTEQLQFSRGTNNGMKIK
jgi:hypothetical protein